PAAAAASARCVADGATAAIAASSAAAAGAARTDAASAARAFPSEDPRETCGELLPLLRPQFAGCQQQAGQQCGSQRPGIQRLGRSGPGRQLGRRLQAIEGCLDALQFFAGAGAEIGTAGAFGDGDQ